MVASSYRLGMAYHAMSDDEVRAFLTGDPARPGVVATTRKNGRPHVAPVWYCVDDDGAIVFTTGATTVKGRTLRRTGWAAMTVDDDRPPFSFVTVEGPVTISDDLGRGARVGRAHRRALHGRRPGRRVRGAQRRARRAPGSPLTGADRQRSRRRRLTRRAHRNRLPRLVPGFPLRR